MSRSPGKRHEILEKLRLAGRQLATATIMFHQAIADRLGLNLTDHKCVDLLLLNGPLSAGELASKTGLTTGAITAALDRLERAGYVRRADDPNDRRRVVVHPVFERVAEMAPLFDSFVTRLDRLAGDFTQRELEVVVDFMTRACGVAHESTTELRQQPAKPKHGKGKRDRLHGPPSQ